MRVETISRTKVEVRMPNGTRLYYLGDRLRAAYHNGNLYTNFNDPDRRAPSVTRAVSSWSKRYGFSGGGERSEREILELAMRPVAIEYGDYETDQRPPR
jgi:hypothetical protein